MVNITQLFLWLMIYSFIGWSYESILCSFEEKKLINRGFLIGPICPVYGFGALIVILLLSDIADKPLDLFLSSIVLTGVLEYFTSYLLEHFFHAKWWDYSHYRFNINGRVCVLGAIVFGLLSVLLLTYIHPLILLFLGYFSVNAQFVIASLCFAVLLVDLFLTVKHLLKLNKRLEEIQIAINLYAENSKLKVEQLKSSLQEKFENSEFYSNHIESLIHLKKFQDRRIFHAFPQIKSIKYEEALEKVKSQITSTFSRSKKSK
ncbi:MAG: putative ABC transporter permease [Cellulosilyticaceae bacterium]